MKVVVDVLGADPCAQRDRGRTEIKVVVLQSRREIARQRVFKADAAGQAGPLVVHVERSNRADIGLVGDIGPGNAAFGVSQYVIKRVADATGARRHRLVRH